MKFRLKIALMFCLGIGISAQGQFLKKLGNKIQQAAEDAVTDKSAEKTREVTNKTMDGIFDIDLSASAEPVDLETLPASYHFDWRYTLQMTTEKGNMNLHYFLNKDKNMPFGSRPEMEQGKAAGDMFMVMDPNLATTTILMENNGTKTGMVMSTPDFASAVDQENGMADFEFKKIGTKKILGYTCQGFEMENDESKITMYMAPDAPVSFSNLYSGNASKQLPKGFDPKWLDQIGENSLMMEMDYVSKNKKGQSAKMTCIALEKQPIDIKLADYKFTQMPFSID